MDEDDLAKNSPAHATDAHCSIIAHITRDELRRYLDRTESGNGFANRFLWICVRRSNVLPEGGRIDAVDFRFIQNELDAAVRHAQSLGEIHRDEAANTLWHEVYPSLSEGQRVLPLFHGQLS